MDLTVFVDIAKLSGIYLGMALGFVIVYRASRVLNLAQPGLIMLGAFAALTYLPKYDSGPKATPAFWLTALALVAAGAVVGLIVYVALVRPMAGESRVSIVLMTLAVLFLLEAAVEVHWRGERGFMTLPGNRVNYTIFGTHVRLFDLVPLIVGLVMWSGVASFYKWSGPGRPPGHQHRSHRRPVVGAGRGRRRGRRLHQRDPRAGERAAGRQRTEGLHGGVGGWAGQHQRAVAGRPDRRRQRGHHRALGGPAVG
jgi:hypothetical protein